MNRIGRRTAYARDPDGGNRSAGAQVVIRPGRKRTAPAWGLGAS